MISDLPGRPLSDICSMEPERSVGTLVLRMHGELDLSADERFRTEVADALRERTSSLIVDLRALDFMDSTGLRALVWLHNHAHAAGLDFAVLYEGGAVTRVMQASGLDRVLPTVDTADALAGRDGDLTGSA